MAIQRISVERETLGDAAYRHIVQGCLNNDIVPGDRLLMDELAEQLGISRTPVREALQRLEREGVIEPGGLRGYVVTEHSAKNLDDRYQAREAIEGFAIEQITLAHETKAPLMRQSFERLLEQPQTTAEEVFLANRSFHRLAVMSLENSQLMEAFELVWNRSITSGIWVKLLSDSEIISHFDEEHRPIMEAIESGDVPLAHESIVQHIRRGRLLHNR